MNFENPSMEDLEQFRKGLFNRLLFEPVTDPGFVRPAGKLHFLVHQSEEMIAKLRQIITEYDKIQAAMSEAQKIFNKATSYMDAVWSFAISTPPIEAILKGAIEVASLPPQERERQRKRHQEESRLHQEAQDLYLQFLPMRNELASSPLVYLTSQLVAAQVWFLLEKSGTAVTKGTQQLFPTHASPSYPSELLSDALDEVVKEAGLPAITPVMHIFKAIFDFIRRQQIIEHEADAAWTDFKLNSFLLAYFAWWTGRGRNVNHWERRCRVR